MNSGLVFDIGMNHGEDTVYYLSRGCRVVAVEANPKLVAENRLKFADAIASAQLIIEPVGILDHAGTATFWVCDNHDDWSSFDHEMGGRNGNACHALEIECVTLTQLLAKHGVPYYLKIDIERADRHCLECLQPDNLPAYISIEAHELDYLFVLRTLGYGQFKVIDQMRHNSRLPYLSNENVFSSLMKKAFWYVDRVRNKYGKVKHLPGSSGPFGEETPGPWLPVEDVAYNWLHFHRGYSNRGNLQKLSWYDFHAKI